MSVLAPPSLAKEKPVKVNNKFLKEALISKTREFIRDEEGAQITIAQALADRLLNIALYAESNTDVISAQKLIYERIYGKAAVEKQEETKEMPKVIFALKESSLEQINESVTKELPLEESSQIAGALFKDNDTGEETLV
ncbi:MAG: hypothetical protein KBT03_11560 [Bacteroidales bacterium]|nr:hypothetical protein [Candidatus Scybalousia scybalohippi]